jgi:hypothetical protein
MPAGLYTAQKSFFGPDGGSRTTTFGFTLPAAGGIVAVDLIW